MKTQFLLVTVLCVVVEGQNYVTYQGKSDSGPIIKDGVPVDTPEVQAAKAAHFEAYERARALAAKNPSNGQYEEYKVQRYQPQQQQPRYQKQGVSQIYQQQTYQQQAYQQQAYQQPAYQHQAYQQPAYQHQAYQQPAYQPHQYQSEVIYSQPKQQNYAIASYSSALPVDTPEVQQARAAHLAALSHHVPTAHYRIRRSIYYESHVPEETPEVQAARIQHLIAHASAHDEDDDDYYEAPHADYYHVPVITKKGVPVNTGEVKAARQQHLLAHKLAKAGVKYTGGYSHHIPVIGPNGIPYDTPEVYIAKTEHLAAHAKELTKHNQWELEEGYGRGYYHL